MKKVLIRTLIVLACLAVVFFLVMDVFVGQLAKVAFNRYIPPMLSTDAHLGAAALSPLSGRGSFVGVTVSNPKGWSSSKALTAATAHVQVVPTSLFSDHIVINQLYFDTVVFDYETHVLSSNIGDILKNVGKVSADKNTAVQPTTNGKPTSFVIEDFKISHIKVRFGVGPTAITLPMNDIVLKNLGTGKGGVSAAEITTLILKTITEDLALLSVKSVKTVGSAVGGAAGAAVEGTVDGAKKLFGGKN